MARSYPKRRPLTSTALYADGSLGQAWPMRKTLFPLVLALTLADLRGGALAVEPADPAATLRLALMLGCDGAAHAPDAMAAQLPGALAARQEPIPPKGTPIGSRWIFALANGGQVLVERYARRGRLLTLLAEYDAPHEGGPRPQLAALGNEGCFVTSARRLVYGADGHAVAVELLDAGLAPTGSRELLDADVPAGRDPGGVTVAQVDTGVNYLLPAIGDRLARDTAGSPLGYDYWEMDPRPFDRHPIVSPFFPERHGTKTASVLLREAPQVRLIPYRYPRPDMSRFAALIDDAAAKGAAILTLSLGSDDREEWQAFAAAAKRHPTMLIVVSAGNDGRDLDRAPVYPAALELANKITVTAADPATGRPARDANWGSRTVDLAVAAENIRVIDFDGEEERVSGSSYAAPRVAALAARLLLAHPLWHAAELEAAIFARAKPVLVDGKPQLRRGVILNPLAP
jgi:hypothetical protein